MYNLLIILALLLTPEEAIRYWANHYEVPVEYAMCVAQKESDLDPRALGDFHMSEPSWGMFQFQPETLAYAERKAGKMVLDSPSEQTRLALFLMKEGRYSWWSVDHLCVECRR